MQGRDSSQLGQIPNFKCFFEALSLFLNNLSNCWTSMKKFIQQNWLFICQILHGQDKSLGYIVMDYDILHLSLLPCCSNTSSCKWRARWRQMQKAWVGWRRPRSMKLIILDIFQFTSKSGYFGHISVFLKVCVFWPYMIPPQSRNSMHLKVGVPPQIVEQADATALWVSRKSAPEQFLVNIKIIMNAVSHHSLLLGHSCESCCSQRNLQWEETHLIRCGRGKIAWRTRRKEQRIVQ